MSKQSKLTPYVKTTEIREMDEATYLKSVIQWENSAWQIVDDFLGAVMESDKLEGIELASGVKLFRLHDGQFLFVGKGIELQCNEGDLILHTDPNGNHYLVANNSAMIHLTEEESMLLR